MITSISRIAALTLTLVLPSCGSLPFGEADTLTKRVELFDGTIVSARDGWCIDTTGARKNRFPAVVVMASCAALGQDASLPQPNVPGVVTVSIANGGIPNSEQIKNFFGTKNVELLSGLDDDDATYFHVDAQDQNLDELSNRHWRVVFGLGPKIVSVVYRPIEKLGDVEGTAVLSNFVDQLRNENSAISLNTDS